MSAQEDFLKRILNAFKSEAEDIIQGITSSLLILENPQEDEDIQEVLEDIYRQAHTLKGAARAVDILEVETICQEMESFFSAQKAGEINFSTKDIEILHKAVSTIKKILTYQIDKSGNHDYDVNGIVISLQNLIIEHKNTGKNTLVSKKAKPTQKSVIFGNTPTRKSDDLKLTPDDTDIHKTESVRISTRKLDRILLQVEDMLSIKLSSSQVLKELQSLMKNYLLWEQRVQRVMPEVELLQQNLKRKKTNANLGDYDKSILNIIKYLHKGNLLAKKTGYKLFKLHRFWDEEDFDIKKRIDKLLSDVKKTVTVPFSEILDLFPKIVHDYCRQHDKKVKLIILGDNIEIDRRILEKLKTPLIHLLRNCLDHGIEKTSVRKRLKKSDTGLIKITLKHSENKRIKFIIEDDGAGINLNKLKLTVKNRPDYQGENLDSLEDLVPYIFKSGISTSDRVTEFSGRGLGLAILHNSIHELEGSIDVKTQKNLGTKFTIELPLSLVTYRGIIVKTASDEFVLPSTKIDRIFMIKSRDVQSVDNKKILYYNREFIPLADLGLILGIKQDDSLDNDPLVVIISNGERMAALSIEAAEDEQEILAKDFNKHLKRIRNISGATILGSGKIVPILNPTDLLDSIYHDMTGNTAPQKTLESKKQRILVVEDSVTSRMLLKQILEDNGYEVDTAFDGQDGYTKLVENRFDLVITDVDMPRLNGFDLTAKIKANSSISHLPVIIVTSLNDHDDINKGKKVGASGYIVKSNFVQTNFQEIIQKIFAGEAVK